MKNNDLNSRKKAKVGNDKKDPDDRQYSDED
jgi:hypothetical protein